MDIRLIEHEKRMVKLGIKLIRKKIGKKATPDNINIYLRSTKSKALIEILDMIDFISKNTKSEWQSRYVKEYGEFGLWLAINHPEMRKALTGIVRKYTKFKDFDIDLKPNIGKFDIFLFDAALKFTIKKLSTRPTYILLLQESYNVVNDLAKYFILNIDDALVNVKDDFTHKTLKTFLWMGVYIMITDTAYRSQSYYAAHELGNEKVCELSKSFFFKPNKWYINLNRDGRELTQKMWDNNEVPRHVNSILEEPCVPFKQKQKIESILKKFKLGGDF
jgi:hypothetical protein